MSDAQPDWRQRAAFRLDSPETEVLRLLSDDEITLNKAREWLREWISKHIPCDTFFRWKLGPLPGYSHAHSRKIRRERLERDLVTVKFNQAWEVVNGDF